MPNKHQEMPRRYVSYLEATSPDRERALAVLRGLLAQAQTWPGLLGSLLLENTSAPEVLLLVLTWSDVAPVLLLPTTDFKLRQWIFSEIV
jgi:hypothetical protein